MSVAEYTIQIMEDDCGHLQTLAECTQIGRVDDNNSIRLAIVRPDGFATYNMALFFFPTNSEYSTGAAIKVELGRRNEILLERPLTSCKYLFVMPAFYGPNDFKRSSSTVRLYLGDVQNGSEAPPMPWPDFWNETAVNAWWGTQVDMGDYYSIKNSAGDEIAQLEKGGGGGGVSKTYVDQHDAAVQAAAEAYTDAASAVLEQGIASAQQSAQTYTDGKVAAETTAREAAITTVESEVDTVGETASDALSAANMAQQAVGEETTARTAADLALSERVGQIETEVPKHALRTEVDAQITAANSARADGDAALQTQVTANNTGLSNLQATVNSMTGGAVYLERLNVPTASVTQQTLDNWAITQGYTKPFRSNITIPDAENHEWAYNADLVKWVDTGVFVASTATQTTLGIVKGTAAALGISINGAGEMSLNTGGKVLTDINFTSAKDEKLAGIAEGANKTQFTSQLTNDSGFITTNDARLSDSRPASDVSAWAKASQKPTYTKSEVGLGNVDNTSDLAKPVSTAVRAELDAIDGRIDEIMAGVESATELTQQILGGG